MQQADNGKESTMKKTESPEQDRTRRPRTGNATRKTTLKAGKSSGIKLPLPRRAEPAGLLEERCTDSEAHSVSFEYFNPDAREVLVAGTFNAWQPKALPMSRQRGGKWTAHILLPPGQYEYRFVVDGLWQDDPMAARFVSNAFGGLNCVVEVKSI
jgi:hypothetical protein